MKKNPRTKEQLLAENEDLRRRLEEAEETLRAIHEGEVDALVLSKPQGEVVFTLKGAESPYRVFFEAMNEGAATLDPDGTILFCNNRFAEMLKSPADKVIGSSIQQFIPPEDRSGFESTFEKGKQQNTTVDISLKREGQELIPVHLSFNTLHGQDMQVICMVAMDLTEHKRFEEEILKSHAELEKKVCERTAELEAANKELEAFSYSVSHDLRAPLRGIDGFSQALLEDYAERLDETGKDYLRRVRSGAQRMSELIEAMLDLSRLTRGEMKRETVDMSAIARTLAAGLKKTEPGRQVEFIIAEEMTVKGDPVMCRALLENLFRNAWKFTGKHPTARIEFGVTEIENRPVYFVRDDGTGFEMAYKEKLFGAFQRLHAPADFPGIGIGLATVQRIIHRHGGTIWAEGEIQKGAVFYFTLPPGEVDGRKKHPAGGR